MSEAERDFLDDDAPDEVAPETQEPVAEPVAETVDEPAQPEPEVPTTPKSKRSTPFPTLP